MGYSKNLFLTFLFLSIPIYSSWGSPPEVQYIPTKQRQISPWRPPSVDDFYHDGILLIHATLKTIEEDARARGEVLSEDEKIRRLNELRKAADRARHKTGKIRKSNGIDNRSRNVLPIRDSVQNPQSLTSWEPPLNNSGGLAIKLSQNAILKDAEARNEKISHVEIENRFKKMKWIYGQKGRVPKQNINSLVAEPSQLSSSWQPPSVDDFYREGVLLIHATLETIEEEARARGEVLSEDEKIRRLNELRKAADSARKKTREMRKSSGIDNRSRHLPIRDSVQNPQSLTSWEPPLNSSGGLAIKLSRNAILKDAEARNEKISHLELEYRFKKMRRIYDQEIKNRKALETGTSLTNSYSNTNPQPGEISPVLAVLEFNDDDFDFDPDALDKFLFLPPEETLPPHPPLGSTKKRKYGESPQHIVDHATEEVSESAYKVPHFDDLFEQDGTDAWFPSSSESAR